MLAPSSGEASPEVSQDGLRVVRLPGGRGGRRSATVARLRGMSSAVARARREGQPPDVIHAHVFSAGFLAVLLGRRWRLPVVVSEHHSDLIEDRLSAWDARIARFTYRQADLVCPVSPLLERSITRLEPRARCEVVPNVVDIDAFAAPTRSPSATPRRRLIAVGLARQKGVPHLFEALRLLVRERPDVTLEIVGDGHERVSLETQAEGLPVTFVGVLPRADLAARMRSADVLAMPSVVESFGIVAVEALAAGLPVVTTSACGAADVVVAHGGLVVPPADPPALSDALAVLLDSREGVPAATIDELRRGYGPKMIAERWDAIYRSVVRTGHV
ncbi:MAG: glycosyltransferase [Actinomycetota bacterium]|nr:glycosyltransferase [Actinomycetota bacterium]